jgi:GNAT superfamily N-acetyltransferase
MWATLLHKESKVGGLLALLDNEVLEENFYRPFMTLAETKHFFAVDTVQALKPIGYLGYRENANKNVLDLPRINLKLIRNLAVIILKDINSLVLAINVIKTEKRTRNILSKQVGDFDEIQIVVVDSEAQGTGVGSEMMDHLMLNFSSRNMIVKTQDRKNLDFYKKFDFDLISTSKMHRSTIFVLMRRPINAK